MATKAWTSKQKRREGIVAKYADIRRQLKKDKNSAALGETAARRQLLGALLRNRCQLTGRSRAVLRKFQGFPHHKLRELALAE